MNCPYCGSLSKHGSETNFECGTCATEHISSRAQSCFDISSLKAEVAAQKSEIRRLQGMLMAWPPKPVPQFGVLMNTHETRITREDVKMREASRRRTLDIVMRESMGNGDK